MNPLFLHHLRRLLLLYSHGLQLESLPDAWQREFDVPLDWRLHGFASLAQMLVNAPSACALHHGNHVVAIADADSVLELTAFVIEQVCFQMEHASLDQRIIALCVEGHGRKGSHSLSEDVANTA